jgi:adenosylcobinamide-GDP ribazoletransferase
VFRSLSAAIRTLSIAPAPGRDPERFSSSLPYFPLVGAALGAGVWGVSLYCQALTEYAWPSGAAALAVLAGVVLTRALHVDGLADWADAVGCLSGRQKRLEVMKDPRLGAFGVAAIALSLGVKWVALTRLVALDAGVWIVAAYAVSRTVQVELAASLPYARSEGGTASDFVSGAGWPHRLAAWALCLAIVAPTAGPAGAAACVAGVILARLFAAWCRSRIGGVTGDLLGAGSELAETAILFAAAAAAPSIEPYASPGAWALLAAGA